MALDFTGLEVSEEVQSKLNAQYDKDVGGVSAKNAELLGKIKTSKDQAAQAEKDRDDAKLAASEAAMTMAKDNEAWIKARDENAALIQSLKEKNAQQEKDFAIERDGVTLSQEISGLVGKHVVPNNPAAAFYMESKYREGLEVRDGRVQPKDVSKDLKQYVQELNDDKGHATYIVGGAGSGGNAPGNQGNSNAGAKEITRAQHDSMSPQSLADHFKSGGTIAN